MKSFKTSGGFGASYAIQAGDTPESIAATLGIPLSALDASNPWLSAWAPTEGLAPDDNPSSQYYGQSWLGQALDYTEATPSGGAPVTPVSQPVTFSSLFSSPPPWLIYAGLGALGVGILGVVWVTHRKRRARAPALQGA